MLYTEVIFSHPARIDYWRVDDIEKLGRWKSGYAQESTYYQISKQEKKDNAIALKEDVQTKLAEIRPQDFELHIYRVNTFIYRAYNPFLANLSLRVSLLISFIPIGANSKIYKDTIYADLKEAYNILRVPSRHGFF